jgi:hypothetical protein
LDDPKVGPYHLLDHLAARGDDVPQTPPDGDEVLQVVNHECADHVDERFPDDVVDEWLLRKSVDRREHICDEDNLGHEQRANRGAGQSRDVDTVLPEDQRTGHRDEVPGQKLPR